MAVYRQKVVFYNEDYTSKKMVIPKIINTDIGFELQFGFTAPKIKSKLQIHGKEYATPSGLGGSETIC